MAYDLVASLWLVLGDAARPWTPSRRRLTTCGPLVRPAPTSMKLRTAYGETALTLDVCVLGATAWIRPRASTVGRQALREVDLACDVALPSVACLRLWLCSCGQAEGHDGSMQGRCERGGQSQGSAAVEGGVASTCSKASFTGASASSVSRLCTGNNKMWKGWREEQWQQEHPQRLLIAVKY
jgi:hypothetical protein